MIRELHVETARRLRAGLNGDADQRAATSLLIGAGHGVWLDKLRGWPEYVRPLEDPRGLDALYVDWRRIRDDFAEDDRAWDEFDAGPHPVWKAIAVLAAIGDLVRIGRSGVAWALGVIEPAQRRAGPDPHDKGGLHRHRSEAGRKAKTATASCS